MSAHLTQYSEDPLSARVWGEAEIASISISPWYRCHGGKRSRTITLQMGNQVYFDCIDKMPEEHRSLAQGRCKKTIEKMLQEAMTVLSTPEV